MERQQRVPVGASPQPPGKETCHLLHDAGALLGAGFDVPLEPGLTRYQHLGAEPKAVRSFQEFHPPEVQRIPDPQVVGVPPTTAHSGAAEHQVQGSARLPHPVRGEPPPGAADAFDDRECVLDGGGNDDALAILQHGAAGPVGVVGHRVRR